MEAVYFIRQVGTRFVKIGMTSGDPEGRRDAIQGCNPAELEIERLVVGHGRETEKALHRRWQHRRVRGEWFDLSEQDVASSSFEPIDVGRLPPPGAHHLATFAARTAAGARIIVQLLESTDAHPDVTAAALALGDAARALDGAVAEHLAGEFAERRAIALGLLVAAGLVQPDEVA